MGIPEPGDPREALVALAERGVLRKLFDYRFHEGDLAGLSLGSLILAALTRIEGDFAVALERAAALLACTGRVLPVTTKNTQVCAELATGWKIVGERDIVDRTPRVRIVQIYLEERAPLYPPCAESIRAAQLVVIGPGALLTGLVPILLTDDLRGALRESRARVAFVCNLLTQPGQTDGYGVRDHVREIETYLDFPVDHILVNRASVPADLRSHFSSLGAEPVEDDIGDDVRVVRGDFLQEASLETLPLHDRPGRFFLHHDPDRLAEAVATLVE
jgi:uncharacterized cofD-like protein